MKHFEWNNKKNEKLKKERDICFEDIILAINRGDILDLKNHPKPKKYPNQKIYIIEINNYAYVVPFVEDDKKVFLKTIFPSRKMTKKYLFNKNNKK